VLLFAACAGADTSGPSETVTPPCEAGAPGCVEETIAEMRQRFGRLAAECDHKAVFALTYLRITEAYRDASADPATFDDVAFMNRLDRRFAELYFDAVDAYEAGDLDEVPPAWRVALDQAEAGDVGALGDAILGINAHINRDLPFVLADLGTTGPDGRSRKKDFDRVNAVLAREFVEVIEELASRFDPALRTATFQGRELNEDEALAIVGAWRDAAFTNAARLRAAPTPEAREALATEIEDSAEALARSLEQATTDPAADPSERDAFCAAQRP
jgi:hypothetical protein